MPAELERFFPGAADWTPAKGETIELGGATLEVTEVDAPCRLAWTFAGQPQSFELVPAEGGCRLIFTHVIDDLPAAQTATGWERPMRIDVTSVFVNRGLRKWAR